MKRTNTILMLLALAAISVFAIGGCSSDDGVTPNEEPQVTVEDSAFQAGFRSAFTIVVALPLRALSARKVGQSPSAG